LIERAYRQASHLGLLLYCQDEAGPFTTEPYDGTSWQLEGHPSRQPHEYLPDGTAKLLTLLHPASGHVHVKGVRSCTNAVLHAWLKAELTTILAAEPTLDMTPSVANRPSWEVWQEGLTIKPTLPAELPPLRMLLVWDNLIGHKTPELVLWLFRHGIMPLYTPLSGSWLNMAESIQRILKRRALSGQHPETPAEIVEWLEATARGWNRAPTPFVWGGKRAARRARSRERRHQLAGSGACTRRPILRKLTIEQWRCAS
jgi:DDE superfamily endonuclease